MDSRPPASLAAATAAGSAPKAPFLLRLPARKRKMPESFQTSLLQQRVRAATKIQRAVRLRQRLAKARDPFSLEAIPLKHAFSLVDPSSEVQHWFDARHFVTYVLTTACFHNPLTRRPLLINEVGRLIGTQPRSVQKLLRATYMASDALQKLLYETEGMDLTSDTISLLDACLEDLLKVAELNFFDFSLHLVEDKLATYEDLLYDTHRMSKQRARATRIRHSAILEHRGVLCPFELVSEIRELHATWDDEAGTQEAASGPDDEEALPTPALKVWVLQRLRFR